MFRSRDQGGSWFSIDTGVFIGGALGIAAHPVERDRLLLATDAGLLVTSNGGRDWQRDPHPDLNGPVYAVAFDTSGASAWAATTNKLLWLDGANGWRPASLPPRALPAQAIAASATANRVYLVGVDVFFVSQDAGRTWSRATTNVPEGEVTAFARVMRGQQELLFLVANATLWMSEDGAQTWRDYGQGLPKGKLNLIFAHPAAAQRMVALAMGQLYASEDYGSNWRVQGAPLPETQLFVRGLAATVDGTVVMVTTHKGLYRSDDGGRTWTPKEGNLPIHLESGPLAADPHDRDTFYAGYALTPYGETWRRAMDARAQQPEPSGVPPLVWVAGAVAIIAAAVGVWWRLRKRAVT